MRILILTNFDVGLYQFRRELIQELLTKNEVYISLPYGELVAPLVEMGCFGPSRGRGRWGGRRFGGLGWGRVG